MSHSAKEVPDFPQPLSIDLLRREGGDSSRGNVEGKGDSRRTQDSRAQRSRAYVLARVPVRFPEQTRNKKLSWRIRPNSSSQDFPIPMLSTHSLASRKYLPLPILPTALIPSHHLTSHPPTPPPSSTPKPQSSGSPPQNIGGISVPSPS